MGMARSCVGVKKYVDSHPTLGKLNLPSTASAWAVTRNITPFTAGSTSSKTCSAW